MDPVCHTLVGAVLAESGLKKRTAYGTATLIIGANLPDIDVLSYLWGPVAALAFRRGLTHGLLGLALLPLLLTGAVVVWHRLMSLRNDTPSSERLNPAWVLALAYVSGVTHPLLDFLNVYGIRLLEPFSGRWFYGDTLFIVDPWIWLILGLGLVSARTKKLSSNGRSHRSGRSARRALAGAAVYVGVSAAIAFAARTEVLAQIGNPSEQHVRVMVAPVAVNPFSKFVVIEDADGYGFATLSLLGSQRLDSYNVRFAKGARNAAESTASRHPIVERFTTWSRFPYYASESRGEAWMVYVADARYTLDPERSWAAVSVLVGDSRGDP